MSESTLTHLSIYSILESQLQYKNLDLSKLKQFISKIAVSLDLPMYLSRVPDDPLFSFALDIGESPSRASYILDEHLALFRHHGWIDQDAWEELIQVTDEIRGQRIDLWRGWERVVGLSHRQWVVWSNFNRLVYRSLNNYPLDSLAISHALNDLIEFVDPYYERAHFDDPLSNRERLLFSFMIQLYLRMFDKWSLGHA